MWTIPLRSKWAHDYKSRWDVSDPAYLTERKIDFRTLSEPGRLWHYSLLSPIHLSKEPSIHAVSIFPFSPAVHAFSISRLFPEQHQNGTLGVGVRNGASNCGGDVSHVLLCVLCSWVSESQRSRHGRWGLMHILWRGWESKWSIGSLSVCVCARVDMFPKSGVRV